MSNHLFIPTVEIEALELLPAQIDWLTAWLENVNSDVENGDVAASICIQAILSELVLQGKTTRNWLEVFEDYLTDEEGKPIAYSRAFGQRLFGFDDQWLQTPIHAIYARWWVEKRYGGLSPADNAYAALIAEYIQPTGWIFNPSVSPTGIRTRMKTELLMSMAMGVEVLAYHGRVADHQLALEAAISAMARTNYLSAEYFRAHALSTLAAGRFLPVSLDEVLLRCEVGQGYCDFSPSDKVDDYMGTATRTSRDFAVPSALAALHALYLSRYCSDATGNRVRGRLEEFGSYLRANPLDLRSFTIRDLTDIPFGTGVSPLEVLAAAAITQNTGGDHEK